MAYLIKIFLIALLFYLIIVVVRGLVSPKPEPGGTQESELVSDALTGVYFDKRKAITISTGGQTLYFISTENRDAWLRRNSQ
ncbi:MAG: hypothetical protein LBE38_10005 [Deltaproteobacteria bacterium]|jgi:hypothetical protein|nr:hypothetical protein [Deltaproteobacteria bacterium]